MVYWLLGSMIFSLLLLSHFPTTVYFLTAVTGYAISVLAIRGLKRSGPKVSGDLLTRLLPIFLVCFFAWLTYFGQPFIYVLRNLAADLFVAPALPPAAAKFPLADLLQIFLFENGRFLFSTLAAIAASSVAVIGFHKTRRFLMYWWLLAIATLIGGLIAASGLAAVRTWTSFAYASLVTPYFLCFLVSRGVRRARLPSMPRFSVKAIMFAVLIMSLVAAYPITPLYPQSGGRFIIDDNSVNSIYVISGIRFFSSVYPQSKLITSDRIFHQLISLEPKLWGKTISLKLESVKSPAELKRELVLFDADGRSGISTLAMSALAPNLRSTLGVVYSNGYFYIALAT
jgi:hypothetical protein